MSFKKGNNYGRKPCSKETRQKISLANRGESNGNYGGLSEEHAQNISKGKKGKYTDEQSWLWKGGNAKYIKQIKEKIAGRPKPEHCEICGSMWRICFDHDHTTGKFRGWICHKCNAVLGFVGDNPEILKTMVVYLIKNSNECL